MTLIECRGRVTTYGYPGDTTPDSNSARAIGAWDNPLGPLSMAVSRDIEAVLRKAGVRPKERVILRLESGREILKQWDDRTAGSYKGKQLAGRYDFFCPQKNNPLEDQRVVGFIVLKSV